MLKRTILIGCIFAALLAGAVRADQATGFVVGMYQGIGTTPCGQFARLYRDNPQYTEEIFFAWGSGFMTALNLGSVREMGKYRHFGSMPLEVQKDFLRTYCASNPLKDYISALLALWGSMSTAIFPKQN